MPLLYCKRFKPKGRKVQPERCPGQAASMPAFATRGLMQWTNFVGYLDAKSVPVGRMVRCSTSFQVPVCWSMLKIGRNNCSSETEAADVKITRCSEQLSQSLSNMIHFHKSHKDSLLGFKLKLKCVDPLPKRISPTGSFGILFCYPCALVGLPSRAMSKGGIYLHQSNRHTQRGAADLCLRSQKIGHKVVLWCLENDSPCWRLCQHRKPIAIDLGACVYVNPAYYDASLRQCHSTFWQRQAVSVLKTSCAVVPCLCAESA